MQNEKIYQNPEMTIDHEDFSNMWENLIKSEEFNEKFNEALIKYKETGVEVAFVIFNKLDKFGFSHLSLGTKSKPLELMEGVTVGHTAEVEMPWEDRPEGYDIFGSFHTHPESEEPSINPSPNDLRTLLLNNKGKPLTQFMMIAQRLLNGQLGLLTVSRPKHFIALDAMFDPDYNTLEKDFPDILMPDENDTVKTDKGIFFSQDHVVNYLKSIGCNVIFKIIEG